MSTLQAINLKNPTYGGAYSMQMDSAGNVAFANGITTPGAIVATNGIQAGTAFIAPYPFYLKNRLINGAFNIAQRALTGTANITVGTAGPTYNTGYTTVDRWFTLATTTGTAPSSAQTIGVAGERQLTITGATGVTAVYVGQRIESINSYDLAGQRVTLSFYTSNSLLNSVNFQLAYITANADNFGTLAVPAATKTVIAPISGSTTSPITVTGTLTKYTATFDIPSNATFGLELLFSVGALTSGSWVLQNVQLELGPVATPFERRPVGEELIFCQRYYEKSFPNSTPVAQAAGRQGAWHVPQLVALSVAQPALFFRPHAVTKRAYPASFQITASTTTLTVTIAPAFGVITLGMTLTGGGLAAGTTITAFGTGTGGAGTYTTSTSNTIATAATATGQSGPAITFYNPDAANAQARNITMATPTDCTLTAAYGSSDDGFAMTFTSPAGSAVNQVIAVQHTAEIEIP